MATKRKTTTKQDLENKIAELEAKLTKLSTQLETKPAEVKPAETKPAEVKPAETKPAEPKKQTLPKGFETKPAETKPAEPKKQTLPKGFETGSAKAEVPKPKEETKQLPATFNEALENAYYTAPMTDFHKYRATVTGYSPSPNRWFVRHTAPVGKVPTSDWNLQKLKVTGYTQPSNQYFATRQRLAYHPPDKTFGSFSGVKMTVEGVSVKKQEAPKPAPKPAEAKPAPKPRGTLPKGMEQQTQSPPPSATDQPKSRSEQLEEYEKDYLRRLEQEQIEQEKKYQEQLRQEEADEKARSQVQASSTRGSLPKGFEHQENPAKPKSSRGTLPKGF